MAQKYLKKDFFENDENIFAGFFMEHREINMHSHEFWELSYVYEGRGTHHYENGNTESIKEGEFIFMSPNVSHCIVSPPPEKGAWVRVCNILLTQEYIDLLSEKLNTIHEVDEYSLKKIISKNEPFCIHLKDDSGSVKRMIMTIAHEYKHFTDGSREIIQNVAESLLIYILRLYERRITNETVTTTKNEMIDDLIKYIRYNFGSNITLEFLAAYAHLSPEYLSRYFKKCTGKKLSDFITETRIEKAKYRLRTSTQTINDICEYCGYRSISNFQKAFKKAVGMSAGEYRKKYE
jgi:AraC-like DNA-binding protein